MCIRDRSCGIDVNECGRGNPLINLLLITVGIIGLVIGAELLVENGEKIAIVFGVPEVIISLTLFALGTSLPELATSVVASLKKQGDIITGNAIGSCIFNLLAVMGVTASVKPLTESNISWVDLGVMLGLTILCLLYTSPSPRDATLSRMPSSA